MGSNNQGPGYTVWEREVSIPAAPCALEFVTGLSQAPNPSDGVVFKVQAAVDDTRTPLFEHHHTEFAWRRHRVDLSPLAGKAVTLRFVTDCGPDNHTTADHAHWGDVFLAREGAQRRRGGYRPERIMTWLDTEPFEASFYFRDVGPATVNLTFDIEGGESVYVTGLHVHNGPDAMARSFEGGVVLGNPSLHPYTFDLQRLFPDRPLRRLQGSAASIE